MSFNFDVLWFLGAYIGTLILIAIGFKRGALVWFVFAIFAMILTDYETWQTLSGGVFNLSTVSGGVTVLVPIDPFFLGIITLIPMGICIYAMAHLLTSGGGGAGA